MIPPEMAPRSPSPVLSPDSETENEIEVDGHRYEVKKQGMSTRKVRGKYRRMYVTKGSNEIIPRTKEGLICIMRSS